METRLIRGVRLAFDFERAEFVTGTPLVVFIHGVGADRTSWRTQLRPFVQNGFDVCAIDMRGTGDSQARLGTGEVVPISIAEFAQDVDALIRELGYEKAHWIGNSMGGVICQEAMVQRFSSVERVVLCNTFAKHPLSEQILPRASQALKAKSLAEFAAERIPLVLRTGIDPDTLKEAIYAMARKDPEAYLASWRATWSPDYRGTLSGFNNPVLIVSSTLDTITPPELSDELQREIPHAERLSIPDAGHLSNVDRPEAFNRGVLEFLLKHAELSAPLPTL